MQLGLLLAEIGRGSEPGMAFYLDDQRHLQGPTVLTYRTDLSKPVRIPDHADTGMIHLDVT